MSCYFCYTVNATEAYYQACLTQNGYLVRGAAGRGKTKADAEQAARTAYRAILAEQASLLKIAD